MISIDNIQKSDNRLDFTISGINSSVANALRRSMISDVQTMAIERVSIIENNGPFPDEFIAHRLGLIPLKVMDPGCLEANFTLDVSFDPEKADENDIQTVYSSSLITDDPVSLVHDDVVLTKITTGQSLKLTAISEMGSGSEHSKWSPCCGTTFKKVSKSSISGRKGAENSKNLLDDDYYLFKIETTGSLNPEETFKKSLEFLQAKLDKFQNI